LAGKEKQRVGNPDRAGLKRGGGTEKGGTSLKAADGAADTLAPPLSVPSV